jgi:hypothetical protein
MRINHDQTSEIAVRLEPILDRVLTLGRGPEELVRWVQRRCGERGNELQSQRGTVATMAQELARLLNSNAYSATLPNTIRDTIGLPIRGPAVIGESLSPPCR